jgi:serine-type D-Ala-D-Ala carboxypeptidase/endopeptidase (penicillin-binding protein 4)
MLAAGTTLMAAGVAILTIETVGNPFAPPPPRATVQPMPVATTPEPAAVLAGTDGITTPAPGTLSDALDQALDGDGLGGRVGVAVADLETGEVLYRRDADVPMTPASTLKLVTAAAALEVLGPEHRFVTRLVAGTESGEVILVGGGDPMLASEPGTAEATQLAELADLTAAALAESGSTTVRLGVDDSLFTGPAISPHWRPTYVPNGVAAPVSALAVDGGRETPGLAPRAPDPTMSAAETFTELLEDRGITVPDGPYRTEAGADAEPIAAIWSAPLADIVEYLIATSDNDAAEVVARHVAIGSGWPGSAEAAAAVVVNVVAGLGLDSTGLIVLDGSGLARGSAVPAGMLVDLLVLAADTAHPNLRPVLTGLPVAAFNGTLRERVEEAPGVVRAKTGTLTGVHSLAGVVAADDGTVYAFALLADDADNALEARAALDAAAVALAECGCATPRAAG